VVLILILAAPERMSGNVVKRTGVPAAAASPKSLDVDVEVGVLPAHFVAPTAIDHSSRNAWIIGIVLS
jgi:hypothetical protein